MRLVRRLRFYLELKESLSRLVQELYARHDGDADAARAELGCVVDNLDLVLRGSDEAVAAQRREADAGVPVQPRPGDSAAMPKPTHTEGDGPDPNS